MSMLKIQYQSNTGYDLNLQHSCEARELKGRSVFYGGFFPKTQPTLGGRQLVHF